MALLRTSSASNNFENYRLDDYEDQKKAYLQGVATEAESILKTARQKAGDILREAHSKGMEQAKAEAQRMREESERKGYSEGLEKGRQEALEQEKQRIEAEVGQICQSLGGLSVHFERESQALLQDAEQTLVNSALDLAKQVTEVESSFNGEILTMRLKKALGLLKMGLKLTLRIPSGAREKLEPILMAHLQKDGDGVQVEWVEDEGMEQGSLVVRSDDAIAEFSTQLQWRALLDKMKLKLEEA